ncbi:MAG: hypothetical protein K0M63_08380 [Weeksellaceae bacterium]|nr:hypothetical protein [Weeksellaceae bacterium]
MKNSIKLLFALFLCTVSVLATAQIGPTENPKKVKSKGFTKTANPFTQYLYIKGFRDYQVVKIETKAQDVSKSYSELRFNSVYSQHYTKKLMYDQFGKWDREIVSLGSDPTLVWRDVKLFADSGETFTVFANGVRSFKHMYAAVNVFDSQNKDCMDENHPLRPKLIKYFSEKIWNLSDSKEFQETYNNLDVQKTKKAK